MGRKRGKREWRVGGEVEKRTEMEGGKDKEVSRGVGDERRKDGGQRGT